MKKLLSIFFTLLLSLFVFAQNEDYKCYPTNWWVDMKWNKVQVMIHSETNLNVWADKSTVSINYPGVKLTGIHKAENRKYLFLDLEISPVAKPGKIKIDFIFIVSSECFSIYYELKPRRSGNSSSFAQGVTSKDFMYLIMPDRFSNGDETNDRVPGMRDQSLRRDTVFNRHGGDLKGIQNHLDYLQSLGVSWQIHL